MIPNKRTCSNVFLLAILSASFLIPVPATASPVSHTDCSRAHTQTISRQVGSQWQQRSLGSIVNFSPGKNGYSTRTGFVACDTRTHQIYLYLATPRSDDWQYTSGDTVFDGKLAKVSADVDCGIVFPFCKDALFQLFESGYNWSDIVHRVR